MKNQAEKSKLTTRSHFCEYKGNVFIRKKRLYPYLLTSINYKSYSIVLPLKITKKT